jgi:broad specificity phosphatase PhoE
MDPLPLRILLVRHGETDWNRHGKFQGHLDVPLNEVGLAQAEALGLVLRKERFAAFYSSPLKRALETVRIIRLHHPGVPFYIEPDLMEMNLGEFDGMEAVRWAALYPEFLQAWKKEPAAIRMPGGETLQEVQDRALGVLFSIAGRHKPGEKVLVCTHNFVILAVLCRVLGISLNRFREIGQSNGSINRLRYEAGEIRAEKLNDDSHLPPFLKNSRGSSS